jgi:hypothetical protein
MNFHQDFIILWSGFFHLNQMKNVLRGPYFSSKIAFINAPFISIALLIIGKNQLQSSGSISLRQR